MQSKLFVGKTTLACLLKNRNLKKLSSFLAYEIRGIQFIRLKHTNETLGQVSLCNVHGWKANKFLDFCAQKNAGKSKIHDGIHDGNCVTSMKYSRRNFFFFLEQFSGSYCFQCFVGFNDKRRSFSNSIETEKFSSWLKTSRNEDNAMKCNCVVLKNSGFRCNEIVFLEILFLQNFF